MNVKIRSQSDAKLAYIDALKRAVRVWIYGDAISIPFVGFITNIISYNRLVNKGITKWDEEGQIIVSHDKIQSYKVFIAVFMLVLLPILLFVLRAKKIIY